MAATRVSPTSTAASSVPGVPRSRTLDPIAMGFNRPPKKRGRLVFGFAVTWVVVVVFCAIGADFLPIEDYTRPIDLARLRPGLSGEFLGTDVIGRSLVSRMVYGARVSLAVGAGAVTIGLMTGGLIGICAGYFRGKFDAVASVLVDSALAFPPLVLLLAISAMTRPTMWTITLQLALLSIPTFARLSRANTMAFAEREFVMAARAMGAKHSRILLREIMPNVMLPLLSYAFLVVASLMVAEGGLSFLGVGIPPPSPSWGGSMSAGRPFLESDPHLVFVPAVVLLITIFSLNIVGDRARRRFDTKDAAL